MTGRDLLEVGRIDKAHGLRGEVVVTLTTERTERLQAGARLHAGDEVVEVASARPHQHRWIVSLIGVGDRNGAERLRGRPLLAEPLEDTGDSNVLWAHEVIGAEVITVDGRRCGPVLSVVANPASDLLELAGGILVPAAFVTDTAGLPNEVVIDPPEGLLP